MSATHPATLLSPQESYESFFADKIAAIIACVDANNTSHSQNSNSQNSADLRDFIPLFFAKMPEIDLQAMDNAQAVRQAASALSALALPRHSDAATIRITQPDATFFTGGRRYTIIELVNDDRPFLVDSFTNALKEEGLDVVETIHPILSVSRADSGELEHFHTDATTTHAKTQESLIQFRTSALPESMSEESLAARLDYVAEYIRLSTLDWRAMTTQLDTVRNYVQQLNHAGIDHAEQREALDFLGWMLSHNFVFLGYIEYNFVDKRGNEQLTYAEGSEIGIFRARDGTLKYPGLTALPADMRQFAREPAIIEISKSKHNSVVHRPVPMDYIGVKRFDKQGNVVGEHRFLGLFTSNVYYQSVELVPFIRRKVTHVLARAGYEAGSHSAKALKAIIEFLPRDELFQMSEDALFQVAMGALALEAHPDVGLYLRRDKYERFVSALIYMPRDKFNTFVRQEITHILEDTYKAHDSHFYAQLTDSPLARLHIILRTTPGALPTPDEHDLRTRIASVVNYWVDELREALLDAYGEARGEERFRIFGRCFSKSYINHTSVAEAIEDISHIMRAARSGMNSVTMRFDGTGTPSDTTLLRVKMYSVGSASALSDILPVFEHLGAIVQDVQPYPLEPHWEQGDSALIRQFTLKLETPPSTHASLHTLKERFEGLLTHVWQGHTEDDSYNSLVTRAGLDWRQVSLLRAYGRYLKQITLPYSQKYVAVTLASYPEITANLAAFFAARFDPAQQDAQAAERISQEIHQALEGVASLSEDRVLRRMLEVMQATLRTNYYQPDASGNPKTYISFKFDPTHITDMPKPVMYREIFVCSPRVEGIHLRGGAVARGGLRWSDRREDFRTEILGLVKAQMVKNAVIVPVGSKGGFVVKQSPKGGDRHAIQQEGIACYQEFLSGLLDITDNRSEAGIVPPAHVVCHDGDDPYLVVAADKGTATFSDIANALAREYGFWLDDAFASGGSVGYDHKKMGITARGAWVAVQRHFREMGVDIQQEAFTVTGIGDMGGDVFGNGMLLSRHIRLVAAFNHRHIFIDPTPDAARSYTERDRLFKAVAGWEQYDTKLLSKGGGIFERSSKTITLSEQVRQMLNITATEMTPDELIRSLLQMPVDLLWNGGIGTYVKAESESHDDVGDRANNLLRVNATELGARVVGEGGNLGFTQLARIEFARGGGRINTDAIDNSAGVDCSDHEVNIKIAFAKALADNALDYPKRDDALARMSDDVAALVLRDNQLQTQALSIAEASNTFMLDVHTQMMHHLEQIGKLDRAIEYLPSDKAITSLRAEQKGLSRPELSVLMAYAKITLFEDLCGSDLPKSTYLEEELLSYFPSLLRAEYRPYLLNHPLRDEIIATVLTNEMINRGGISFYFSIQQRTARPACDIARAYVVARDALGLGALWSAIEALDGKVSHHVQVAMFDMLKQLLEHTIDWLLRHAPQPLDITASMARYSDGVQLFATSFARMIPATADDDWREQAHALVTQGVPEALANTIASYQILAAAFDVVSVATSLGQPLEQIGRAYFAIGERLDIRWLRMHAKALPANGHWEQLAIRQVAQGLYDEQRRLSHLFAQDAASMRGDNLNIGDAIDQFLTLRSKPLSRYSQIIAQGKESEQHTLALLIVALRQLQEI